MTHSISPTSNSIRFGAVFIDQEENPKVKNKSLRREPKHLDIRTSTIYTLGKRRMNKDPIVRLEDGVNNLPPCDIHVTITPYVRRKKNGKGKTALRETNNYQIVFSLKKCQSASDLYEGEEAEALPEKDVGRVFKHTQLVVNSKDFKTSPIAHLKWLIKNTINQTFFRMPSL